MTEDMPKLWEIEQWRADARQKFQRGKIYFHPQDGGTDAHWPRDPLPGSVFYRDDPPTLEVYAHAHGNPGQVFLDARQLVGLAAVLELEVSRSMWRSGYEFGKTRSAP